MTSLMPVINWCVEVKEVCKCEGEIGVIVNRFVLGIAKKG